MSKPFSILVFVLTGLFLFFFFVWPIGEGLRGAFFDAHDRFTILYVAEVFKNPIYVEGLRNAFLFAGASTVLAIFIAFPLAVVSDRYLFPGKGILTGLILVPMILPPFVGAIGIKQILGQKGSLNSLLEDLGLMDPTSPIDWLGESRFWGVVLMNAIHLYPILYLNIVAALANLDPAMEEAAENLGCTGLRKLRKITIPLIMPGLFAGGTIAFISAFTELGVPLMFGFTRVTSVQIFTGINDMAGNPFPFALVAVMLATSILLFALSKLALGRSGHAMIAKATSQGGPRSVGRFFGLLCTLLFCVVTSFAILPNLAVILVSLSGDWYGTILPSEWRTAHFTDALSHDLALPSIQNSIKYAGLSTLLDLILGVAIAYVVTRTRLVGREILDAIAMLPLAVPGIVLAFGYYAMTQEGQVFAALNPLKDPLAILVIAYSVRRLPFIVRSAAAGFEQTSVTFEEAAQNLGCPPFKTLAKITIPLITANLLAGALLTFSFAMLEVSDSLILAQRQQDYPITKAIYELYQLLGNGRFIASALGVWAMCFLATTVIGASLILGKKLGAIFRF